MTTRRLTLFLAIAAMLCLGVTLVTVWYVGTDGDRLASLSAWSTFAAAVATCLAAAGAGVAVLGIAHQLAEARLARAAALRPLVVVSKTWSDNGTLGVTVENVGPGPALEINVRAWPVFSVVPDPHEVGMDGYERFIAEEATTIDRDDFVEGGKAVLAPNAREDVLLAHPDLISQYVGPRGGRAYFEISYLDVFGTTFVEPAPKRRLPHSWFLERDHGNK